MGKAFIKGITHSAQHEIYLVEPDREKILELKNKYNINVSDSDNYEQQIRELLKLTDIILLCIKPQTFNSIKDILKENISDKQIVLSIMAGINTKTICEGLDVKNSIRIMPNTPGQVGKGISVWYTKESIEKEFKSTIENILKSLGDCIEVNTEEIIDKATAISGSGPGFIFYFMETMMNSCKEIGMDENLSKNLIIKTLIGSGELAKLSDKNFKELKNEVTSPSGTTEAGLNKMRENNFEESIFSGIKAAYDRALELSND